MTNLTLRAVALQRKRAEQEIDRRIERAFRTTCCGVQINIMDIGKVFHEGRKLLANGADDAALASGIRAFVDTLAVRR